MNNTIKNILIFGIPMVIIMIIVIVVIKEIHGEKSKCPLDDFTAFDGTCLQCNPQDADCAVCTKNSDCNNGGTCYTDESSNGKGVCICTGDWVGTLCNQNCNSSSDCNGNPCTNNKCRCTDGSSGANCENRMTDMSKCRKPNCNSILITKLKVTERNVDGNATVVLMLYMDDDYLVHKINTNQITTMKLGGFQLPPPAAVNTFWGGIADDTECNIVSIEEGNNGNGNTAAKCWYYCNSGKDSCDPNGTDISAPFYPPQTGTDRGLTNPNEYFPDDYCNPGDHGGKCFFQNCPKYYFLTITVPNTAIGANVSLNHEHTYNADWNTAAYIQYEDTVAICYNNSASSGDGDYCRSCQDNWGPTFEGLDPTKPMPEMGTCGRLKNDHPIGLALFQEDVNRPSDDSTCQASYGPTACNDTIGKGQCETDDDDDRFICNVDNYWSLPGTNCQIGAWDECVQNNSGDGANDQRNFFGSFCSAIPSKVPPNCKIRTNLISTVGIWPCCMGHNNKPDNLVPPFPTRN